MKVVNKIHEIIMEKTSMGFAKIGHNIKMYTKARHLSRIVSNLRLNKKGKKLLTISNLANKQKKLQYNI